jgi:hypothetical protein
MVKGVSGKRSERDKRKDRVRISESQRKKDMTRRKEAKEK